SPPQLPPPVVPSSYSSATSAPLAALAVDNPACGPTPRRHDYSTLTTPDASTQPWPTSATPSSPKNPSGSPTTAGAIRPSSRRPNRHGGCATSTTSKTHH